MKNSLLWGMFISVLFIISVSVNAALNAVMPATWSFGHALALGASAIIFAAVTCAAMFDGWTIVPQNHEYIVEVFGKYIGEPAKAGLHILFPWFNLVAIHCDVNLAQRMTQLYLPEGTNDNKKIEFVEFNDVSIQLVTFLTYKVKDSALATYGVDGLEHVLQEHTESLLTSYFRTYNFDDLDEFRNYLNLATIACMIDFCPDVELSDDERKQLKKDSEAKYAETDYCKSLSDIGIEAVSLIISDFQLPEEMMKARQEQMKAEIAIEVAKLDKDKAAIENEKAIAQAKARADSSVIEAEAQKAIQILLGSGQADRIKQLIESGLSAEEAAAVIIKEKQWGSLEKGGNTVTLFEGSNNGMASLGAELGAGFMSNMKK